jgi:hypothetical protein
VRLRERQETQEVLRAVSSADEEQPDMAGEAYCYRQREGSPLLRSTRLRRLLDLAL